MIAAFMPGSTEMDFYHSRLWAIFVPRSYRGQVLVPNLGGETERQQPAQLLAQSVCGWGFPNADCCA